MLNSRQRAQLRGLANSLDTIFQVGKGGVTENTVKQVDDALEAREKQARFPPARRRMKLPKKHTRTWCR